MVKRHRPNSKSLNMAHHIWLNLVNNCPRALSEPTSSTGLARTPWAWITLLNTFAHAGGFSIAAATAGAQTLSIDLSKHWLGFIPRQLAQLGIDAQHHDCIYGDIFDWLPRLAKRGEKFDLIILDPPSTSVGRKKKRWSARTHYRACQAGDSTAQTRRPSVDIDQPSGHHTFGVLPTS